MGICYILRCLVIYYEAWYAFKFKKKKLFFKAETYDIKFFKCLL